MVSVKLWKADSLCFCGKMSQDVCRVLLISPAALSQDEDFVTRDDFEDVDQLRIGNDGIFMLTFFSEFPNSRASFLFLWCIALKHRLLFPVAFLFNWIGFFLSFCLTTSAAGRYGAISGFGLSLIKWVLIVRVYTYFIYVFIFKDWTCLSKDMTAGLFLSVFSSLHIFPVTLMDSTGCGGSSWCWVSRLNSWIGVIFAGFKHCPFSFFHLSGFLLFLRGFINYARIRKMADTLSTLPRTRVLFIY